MVPPEEEEVEEAGLELQCRVCERICDDPNELADCYACRRRFCTFCVFRIGGKEFCSRLCGTRYFFGSDDDDDLPEDFDGE